MKILVRLPNWLGDMVMSTGFLRALRNEWPGAEIDVVVKQGLDSITELMPSVNARYIFSKEEYKGITGAYRFGRMIGEKKQYDLFFCLPDSFSSAFMGWGVKAKKRIGFRKELRSLFLTNSYKKPENLHRVEEYVYLLDRFTGKKTESIRTGLATDSAKQPNRIILNFNSEAISRRVPVHKAVSILQNILTAFPVFEFICIGSKRDREHVQLILKKAGNPSRVIDQSGTTNNIKELAELIGTGAAQLTTDSGPAHIGNALGVPVVVLFGAGNENNTAPFNKEKRTIIRLGQLACEPCVKNTCIYGLPKCLELLDEQLIIAKLKENLH
jgi:heptosyltransferase II